MQVLLLIWKLLLAVLGGWKELREGKAAKRIAANLRSVEDTLLVASAMKSSSINGNDSEQNEGSFCKLEISNSTSLNSMKTLYFRILI